MTTKAKIAFWEPIPGTDTAKIVDEVKYDSLDAAAAAFKTLYDEYPTVMFPAAAWFPTPAHRVAGTMTRYGKEIVLYYWDNRQGGGWYHPEMGHDENFYVPAITKGSASVPGYGYMRRDEPRPTLPTGTVQSSYCAEAGDMLDPVKVAWSVVEQSEIDRVAAETGELPTHITHMDYSGSFLYIAEIVWGDEAGARAEMV